jgi:AraC-like DNA-binding protein
MLRKPFYLRARAAVAPMGSMALRAGTPDFIDAVIRGSADVAVVDPTLAARDHDVTGSLARAHLGTVIYIQLTPEYAQASVGLLRELGSGDIITFDYNDDPATFADILMRQSRAHRGQLLVQALAPQISALPPTLRNALDRISEQGHRIDSVDRLASVCGVARGTLLRNFKDGGIKSASGFVAALTLLRNYDALIDEGVTTIDVARAMGLSSERALQRRCVAISGLSLSEIRRPVSIQYFAERIARVLTSN